MDSKELHVKILWTGGWDSTFRILQLAKKDVIIQPYYIIDHDRKSQPIELDTIGMLTRDIQSKNSTHCVIRDLISIEADEIPEDTAISDAYQSLKEKVWFGGQYDWFARIGKNIPNLELTVHTDDKALAVINEFGKVIKKNDGSIGEYYVLDTATSSRELSVLFGGFRFPLLNYTKLDMKKEAEEHGFIEIMHKTWFCHRPVNNEACGSCNPCVYTIEEGMGYRLSKSAMKRYKRRQYARIPRQILVALGLSPVIDKIRRIIYPVV